MTILVVKPCKVPEIVEIEDDLKQMQAIVGGYIQIIYPFDERVALVCNDEGKLLGLPLNRALRNDDGELYDIISGTFFLCGAPADSDSFASLTPEQVEKFKAYYRIPEMFIRFNDALVCLPMLD